MIVVIVLLTLGFTPPVAAQPWQICGDTVMNYTTSSRRHANLELLSTKLTDKATTSPDHFATDFAGVAPDTVYSLALCRGDVNSTACRACIAAACVGAQQLCPHRADATVFYPTCRLRFSGKNFLHPDNYSQIVDGVVNTMSTTDTTNTAPGLPGWDAGNAESVAAITEIVRELLQETARQAAYNSGARMFATGRMDAGGGRSFPALYSMAQCVPALTHRDCSSCLQVISFMATDDNFAGRQGGRLLALWCNLRYDTVHFYSGDPMVTIVSSVKEVVPPAPLVVPSRKHKSKGSQDKTKMNMKEDGTIVWGLEGRSSEFMIYDFSQVLEATDNFSEENKLGQGGFGPVYKGRFHDGLEVAVKRLASHSGQGFTQFKNEVQLIAKLQHTNLVRLLGCCSQEEEKILIYECLPNKSLDLFIFDDKRRVLLNWTTRLAIIEGIAQGLLYLHKHSRLRVIHRDLKASNILLDHDMNPKISDFGMARIFSTNNAEANTERIVGTYGYMAPEYASEGLFSIKSDVFSFGVLTLEIVSGKRSSGFRQYGDFINLLGHAWQLWKDKRWLQIVDASLVVECHTLEIMRCINVALLCVQENAADRPTMSDVVVMLSSESMTLPEPKHPAYFHIRVTAEVTSIVSGMSIVNDTTISTLRGR
ncbi:hypothetical protein PVAP13_8NG277600 [Panicum virgatum]|uniref:Uncharacterized protein n=1 Tax=Panicum virgatum TaxID=38727 RepID=A0A8T0P9X1_PANVG|nr:hypothetical protein PVAP13_8NG277600 [Panicum virgatum]